MTQDTVSPHVGLVVVAGDDPAVRQRPTQWALTHLIDVVRAGGTSALRAERTDEVHGDAVTVVVTDTRTQPADDGREDHAESAESFSIGRPDGARGPVVVAGSDGRGLAYGLLELADRAAHSTDPLEAIRSVTPSWNTPATPVRSILRTFACEVEDKPWFYDREFWTEYLTELASNRINRFQQIGRAHV